MACSGDPSGEEAGRRVRGSMSEAEGCASAEALHEEGAVSQGRTRQSSWSRELEGKSERQGSAHGPAVAGTAMKGLDCTQLKRRYGGVRVEKKYLWLPLAMFTHFHMEKVLEWGVQTVWKSDRGQEETLTIQVKNNCALD